MASATPGGIGIVIGRCLWWVGTAECTMLPAYSEPQFIVDSNGFRLRLDNGHWNENRQGSLLPIVHHPKVTRKPRGKQ